MLAGKRPPEKEPLPAPQVGPFAHWGGGGGEWDEVVWQAQRRKVRTFSHPDLTLQMEHEGYEVPTGINDYMQEVSRGTLRAAVDEWVRRAAFNTKVRGSNPASVMVGGVPVISASSQFHPAKWMTSPSPSE